MSSNGSSIIHGYYQSQKDHLAAVTCHCLPYRRQGLPFALLLLRLFSSSFEENISLILLRILRGRDSTSFSSYVAGEVVMQLRFVAPLYCRPYGGLWSSAAISKAPPLNVLLSDSMYSISMYSISMYSISTIPHWMYSCLTLALLWRPAHPLSRIMVEVPVMVVGPPLHIDNAVQPQWMMAKAKG